MFKELRVRLSLLYLVVGLLLLGLISLGTLRLISHYFQNITDLALKHRMSQEIRMLGEPLPPELELADREWYSLNEVRAIDAVAFQSATTVPQVVYEYEAEHEDEGEGEEEPYREDRDEAEPSLREEIENESYEGELASIYTLQLNADGDPIGETGVLKLMVDANAEAMVHALIVGRDLRTVRQEDGTRVRILTYPVSTESEIAALQLGRKLNDQDRVFNQLIMILLGLGGFGALFLGFGSWWLAGRSITPAQLAWEKQQEFIANASHELRTPLTLIRASAEVAQRNSVGIERQQELHADILRESDYMSRLLEDLLLLSRLDAGRLVLESARVDLPELLQELKHQLGVLAQKRAIEIILQPSRGEAWADPTRVRQVLLILLDNAMHFTPNGGAINLQSETHRHKVRIRVKDSGPGMPPDILRRAFDRFYRAEGQEAMGHGLGLSIAKALTEAQGGQLRLISRVGGGTEAVLTLPSAS